MLTCPRRGAELGGGVHFTNEETAYQADRSGRGVNYKVAVNLAVEPEFNSFSTTPAPWVLTAAPWCLLHRKAHHSPP